MAKYTYLLQSVEKIRLFAKEIRWKAIFYDMKVNNNSISKNWKDSIKNNNGGVKTKKKILGNIE